MQTISTPQVTCLAISSAGEELVVAVGDADGIIRLLYESGVDVQLLWHAFGVNCLQFSADGNYLFSGGVEVCFDILYIYKIISTCL